MMFKPDIQDCAFLLDQSRELYIFSLIFQNLILHQINKANDLQHFLDLVQHFQQGGREKKGSQDI